MVCYIRITAVLILSIVISGLLTTAVYAQQEGVEEVPVPALKRRIAVFSFEDKTDYGRYNVGQGMADMLTTDLVKSGKYIVMERQQIEHVMQEQQLGLTGAVTQQTAAQVGKLLGVELAVFGAVTEFGEKKQDTGGKIKGFGLGVSKASARVAIDVRIVNTETGQILAADNVVGEENKSGLKIDTKEFDFDNRAQFDKTLVGKATRKAIEQIIAKIDAQMGSTPWSGKIIKVSGPTIYINGGADIGLLIGNVLEVYQPGEDLIDPDTGLNLGSEETKIGEVQIIDVQDKFSKAIVRSGSGFDRGNIVRP
jgi:curli biogenesis system outer membrane secretion channel CsgG